MSVALLKMEQFQPLVTVKKHEIRVPSAILFDHTLDDFAYRVYCVLRSIQGIMNDGWGYLADQQVLASQTGRSKSQISKALSVLKGKYVKWETGRFERNRTVYSIRFRCYETASNNYEIAPKRSYKPRENSFHTETPSFQIETPSFQIETPSFQIETPSFQIETPSFQIETEHYIINNKPTKNQQEAVDVKEAVNLQLQKIQQQQPNSNFDFAKKNEFSQQAILLFEKNFSDKGIRLTDAQKEGIANAVIGEKSFAAWTDLMSDYAMQYDPQNPQAWNPSKISYILKTILPERITKAENATNATNAKTFPMPNRRNTPHNGGMTYNEMLQHCQKIGDDTRNYEIVKHDHANPKNNLWAKKQTSQPINA